MGCEEDGRGAGGAQGRLGNVEEGAGFAAAAAAANGMSCRRWAGGLFVRRRLRLFVSSLFVFVVSVGDEGSIFLVRVER